MLRYICKEVEWQYVEEKDELSFILHIPEAQEAMTKLLADATQLDLSFSSEYIDNEAYLTFVLRSGNGELAVLIRRNDWIRFLEEPDRMVLNYGTVFEMDFLPVAFLKYIDSLIDRVNQGENTPFLQDIIAVFAEEE